MFGAALAVMVLLALPTAANAANSSTTIDIATLTTDINTYSTYWSYEVGGNKLTITENVTITGTKTGVITTLYIEIATSAIVTWNATYTGDVTGSEGLINLTGTGMFTMTGGTLRNAAVGLAISNNSTGALNISGGTVETTLSGSTTISNYSTGTLNITDGMVRSTGNNAIWNDKAGIINIGGGTVENTSGGVAIHNQGTGEINISGGTVQSNTGSAINKHSIGTIKVIGGVVSNKSAALAAISNNNSGGTISVDGGFVFSYGTATAHVIGGMGTPTINGGTIVAWNQAPSKIYDFGTDDDLAFFPAGTSNKATWHISGVEYGLLYDTDKFFKVDGATVSSPDTTPPTGLPDMTVAFIVMIVLFMMSAALWVYSYVLRRKFSGGDNG